MPQPLSNCGINLDTNGAMVVGGSGMPIRNIIAGAPIRFAICNACDYPIEMRPNLLAGAMRVISAWSVCESHLHRIFTSLLQSNPEQGIAMFLSLESDKAKKDVLMAAASVKLSDEDMDILKAILDLYKNTQRPRNKIAHHLWGYSDFIPDGILLMNPKDYLVWQSSDATEKPIPSDKIFIYKKHDFVEIVNSIERLSSILHDFYFMIGPHARSANEIRQRLLSLPDISVFLSRLQRHQRTPQAVQPQQSSQSDQTDAQRTDPNDQANHS